MAAEEDLFAYTNFFWKMRGGVYLEAGALDGYSYSNTLLFDHYAGWCVDVHQVVVKTGIACLQLQEMKPPVLIWCTCALMQAWRPDRARPSELWTLAAQSAKRCLPQSSHLRGAATRAHR